MSGMTKDKTSDDFTVGSIPGKLAKFMVPIFGALVLQAMYGAVDLFVVGKFGSDAGISAASTGSNLINLVTFLITGLTMGVTVCISRYIGEQKRERISKVIGGAVSFFIVMALVLMVVLLLGAPLFTSLLKAPEEAYDLTVTYIRICGGGIVFVVAYNVISGIFRGLGNSRLPLLFVFIACMVNVAGDLLFVAGFGMDVAGAAIATILAQAVSVVMSFFIIRKKKDLPFAFSKSDIGFNPEVKNFLRIGFPIALQDFLCNISFLILCAIINNLGLEASSGYGVAQKITAFIMLVPSALMQSTSTFVAQNAGAGNQKRARLTMRYGMMMGVGVGVFVFLFIVFKGELPSSIFTDNPAYIAKSVEYLRGFGLESVLTSFVFCYMGYFNGNGKTVFVMAQSLAQTFVVRIPVSYFMSIQENVTLTKIGFAAPAASVFGIFLCTIYYVYLRKKESVNLSGDSYNKKNQ